MTAKQIHLTVSIVAFLSGLFLFLSDLISDNTLERLGLLFLGLLLLGGYGITRYIYDK